MTPRVLSILVLVGLVAGAASPVLSQSTVVLRGNQQAPSGTVTGVGLGGVEMTIPALKGVKSADGALVLSWDRVARVEGELASAAAPYMAMAEQMWRARSRLERGDSLGAEPLFEELYRAFAGKRGASAVVVAGGLLRCRLMEGAQTAALAPWLSYANAINDGESTPLPMPGAEPTTGPAVDSATQLAPMVPPVWVNLTSVQALARGPWPLKDIKEGARPKAVVLEAWYEQAARFEVGLPVQMPTATIERDDGVALVREVVTARIGNDAERAAARTALMTRLKKRPAAWIEVWCRVGIGRSLLKDASRDSQLLGINELLEVAARLERVNPYLTGVALAESSVALYRLGDKEGATRVRNDFLNQFGGHPVLEWDALRSWTSVEPMKAAPSGTVPQPASQKKDSEENPGGGADPPRNERSNGLRTKGGPT